MVKANDPRYQTPRLILGWAWAALGLAQLAFRLPAGAESQGYLLGVILGAAQIVLGAVVLVQAWRLPKRPPLDAARTDAGAGR
ncbi:hypothetical protein HOW07_09515 [Plantibacter sp. MCCC 1A11337]|uniref:hypothetical protein n=1 Tax=Plantibacter sp. MCCC 1A11337 TaxID=2736644 RepID=UPI0015831D03|nr:hypothetical protein [Plantibacter sp. MCCC 1A11337]NUJ88246.1 hypothetical protein [Plantibacter sp. MCCC 1A11337]